MEYFCNRGCCLVLIPPPSMFKTQTSFFSAAFCFLMYFSYRYLLAENVLYTIRFYIHLNVHTSDQKKMCTSSEKIFIKLRIICYPCVRAATGTVHSAGGRTHNRVNCPVSKGFRTHGSRRGPVGVLLLGYNSFIPT